MHAFSTRRTFTGACLLTCLPVQDAGSTVLNDTLSQNAIPVISRSSTATRNGSTPVDIELVINGKSMRAQGAGECKHEPDASIYRAPASLWRVEYGDPKGPEIQHLSLTVWQLKKGGENQMSLALKTGTDSYSIATVKGGKVVGTGNVTFRPEKPGGRFEVQGADARAPPSWPGSPVPVLPISWPRAAEYFELLINETDAGRMLSSPDYFGRPLPVGFSHVGAQAYVRFAEKTEREKPCRCSGGPRPHHASH